MNLDPNKNKEIAIWFSIVIVVSIVLRVLFLSVSTFATENDTVGYIKLAEQIVQHDLSQDNGLRTPGYPLFLILFGIKPAIVRLAQMGLGILITAMLFIIAWQLTHNIFLSAFVGASYGCNITMISWENLILTETLTTFCVVLSIVIFIFLLYQIEKHQSISSWLILEGVISAFTSIVRPTFLFLPVLFAVIIFFKLWKEKYKNFFLSTVLFLLPFIVAIGGWSTFNYIRFGYWGPSTITGYSLTDHSVKLIQYAPDQFAVIRDSYLDVEQHLQPSDDPLHVWSGDAITQIQMKTGWTFPQLSRELTKMAIYLFINHPFLYAKNVFFAWIPFWDAKAPWISQKIILNQALQNYILRIFYIWKRLEHYGTVVLFSIPFFITLVGMLMQFLFRKKILLISLPILMMCSVIFITSLLQAMTEYGDSMRYALPVRGLVICVVVSEAWWIRGQINLLEKHPR
jgi:hypothetical protein